VVSERTARLDQLLREEISALLAREIADPRIGFVTVTDVDVTPDLAHATVWVSVIGDADAQRRSLAALARAMPYVRHRLGGLHLKRIPELHVRADESAQRGTRVLQILRQLEQGEEGPAIADLPQPITFRGTPEPREPRDRTSRHKGTHPAAARRRPAR
jgi:ribosome-binding factor A